MEDWQSPIPKHIVRPSASPVRLRTDSSGGELGFLVRWLSGRKQRFAKAPYPKRVPRVRIPPSPPPIFLFLSVLMLLFRNGHQERRRRSRLRGSGRAMKPSLTVPILLFSLTLFDLR